MRITEIRNPCTELGLRCSLSTMKTKPRPGRPKTRTPLSVYYSFRLTADQLAKLERAAARRKSTTSATLRQAIEKISRDP